MSSPDELELRMTLRAAVERFDELREQETLADDPDGEDTGSPVEPLRLTEALELLALGEVIARKAGYGRQLTIRAARASGGSWSQIGQSLGTTKQSAWESHRRWIDEQVQLGEDSDHEGLGAAEAARARALLDRADGS